MKKKKLSHIEVEAAVNGIRKKYNDLIVEYMKPKIIKDSFEDRYIGALRARVDMGNFIYTEILVVSNLLKIEKENALYFEYWFNPVPNERSLEYNGVNLLKKKK